MDQDRERQESDQNQQVQKRYQTLLPAVESSPVPRSLASDPNRKLPPKRKLVLVACSRCRLKKEKCDGERPSCGRCIAKAAECQYEVDDAKVSRASALKRKCDILQDENDRLRELFGLLRQRSKPEAQNILSRIRNSEDPLAVWRSIKDAELLLPSASSSRSGMSPIGDPVLDKINAEALADSLIKVKASPWTAVAGDGIVSDLVSSFFTWDNTFRFSFIDRDCFFEDMALGMPDKSRYCSPFLVNAMCAVRCYTSARAKAFSAASGEDLASRFINEAKRLLALEFGRSSLPTAQGLTLLFMTSVFDGSDRVGMMYRLMGSEMLRGLNLEAKFAAIEGEPSKNDEKRALSKALWGHFISEKYLLPTYPNNPVTWSLVMLAYAYLQASLTSPPMISCAWLEPEQYDHNLVMTDSSGKGVSQDSSSWPRPVPGALVAASEVAKLLYDSMKYNSGHNVKPGSAEDLQARRDLYAEVLGFANSLPARLRSRINFTPQTCLLSIFINEVAISILRSLGRDTIFGLQAERVKDLFIQHCSDTVDLLDQYVLHWPLAEYTYTIVCCANNVSLAMIPILDDAKTHSVFARVCRLIDASARDFPISAYVLQGIQALAWTMKVEIPPAAVPYLQNTTDAVGGKELRDLPVALRIPYLDAAANLALDDKARTAHGAELGTLLSKWNAMSLEA